jgi:uncharacterized protein (TIGR02421 family)
LIAAVCTRLAANKRVRRTLPDKGRLHIDRQLPFLCVYRQRTDDRGTHRLVTGEASYLVAPSTNRHPRRVSKLVRAVAETMVAEFGAFLVVEVWADTAPAPSTAPMFRIVAPDSALLSKTVDVLAQRLGRIRVMKRPVEVEVFRQRRASPPGMPPLLGGRELPDNCWYVGLAVPPVYRDPKTGRVFPPLLRTFRRSVGRALRPTFHRFVHAHTTHRPPHYHELGRRAVVKAVWTVDHQLSDVSNAFDFLLQATPINSDDAWREFRRSKFERAPEFYYRPTPYDPTVLKRRLYRIPVERVEDPALLQLFRQKQDELDRRITMLLDINTSRFVHGSVQVFGGVDDDLLRLARQLLKKVPPRTRDDFRGGYLELGAFRRAAETELEHYRRAWPQMNARVQVRSDIAAGLMVSRGSLLIGKGARIPASRVAALLAHEVGTHVLTYYNGRAQPFRQLYSGLANYDTLQEGLAVLAEYLVGGLSRPRIRLLAGRVVAARSMLDGADFMETFRRLVGKHGFDQRTAFLATMRVYRGGGLTKDAVYLRGLCDLLGYLARGGTLEPLYVGKIAVSHIPIIRELQYRQVLKPAPLRPRFLDLPEAVTRLERARAGLTVIQLLEKAAR